ncbi:hypothetical protein ACH4VQ_35630 [Streptomyces anulatus]|uniref:hypothetical protein n=1 Tax=Streptomyces anulatus TaxID=1892 RepID=UPI0036D1C27F|nr:hypothetical protein [Streptomyces sp. HB372]
MDEWVVALIAAGAAVLASGVTGFFAWKAGHRQAEGAERAGQTQADAAILASQAALDEQRRARAADQRRQTYAHLLATGEQERGNSLGSDKPLLLAVALVELEGPQDVVAAALEYRDAIGQMNEHWDDERHDLLLAARSAFIEAAQRAIRNA